MGRHEPGKCWAGLVRAFYGKRGALRHRPGNHSSIAAQAGVLSYGAGRLSHAGTGRGRGFSIVASGLLPGAIEIMDALALEAAVAAVHAEYPPGCAAVLIVELEGPREVVAADRVRLDEIIA